MVTHDRRLLSEADVAGAEALFRVRLPPQTFIDLPARRDDFRMTSPSQKPTDVPSRLRRDADRSDV